MVIAKTFQHDLVAGNVANYRQTSNINRTKSHNLNVSRLILQLS